MYFCHISLILNHDGVPQNTRPQLNIIIQTSGITTSIIDPRRTFFSEWWRWEHVHNFNFIELLRALKTLNLAWNVFTLLVVWLFLFFSVLEPSDDLLNHKNCPYLLIYRYTMNRTHSSKNLYLDFWLPYNLHDFEFHLNTAANFLISHEDWMGFINNSNYLARQCIFKSFIIHFLDVFLDLEYLEWVTSLILSFFHRLKSM